MDRRGRRSKGNSGYRELFQSNMSNNYATPSLTIVAGKGAYLFDADGRRFLDFISGIATNVLGAAHPKIISAVNAQVRSLSHISNLYANPESLKLAESLRAMTGDPEARVFFCNSGAEANEAAIKLAYLTGRRQIVAMEGAFHGRTIGALSITGQPAKREPFEPLLKKVRFVPFGDLKALSKAVSRRTAMVILEPIQGEYGVVVPPRGYLKGVEKVCTENGALLAIDAVQTGMGRTGTWFGFEDEGIKPDIITMAKGLGGGLPMGAMISMGRSPRFAPGQHGSTFGGNPIVSAAANAVIETIKQKDLMARASHLHQSLVVKLQGISGVETVRGKGLLIGIVLARSYAKEVVQRLEAHGILVNATSDDVIRLAPPLIISEREVNRFVDSFKEVMAEIV